MTQSNLAQKIGVSDKAVSKWERGLGLPDISILPYLANALGVDIKSLMEGNLAERSKVNGNIKKLKFYVCPTCHNLIFSTGDTNASCCGKNIDEQIAKKCGNNNELSNDAKDGGNEEHDVNIEVSDGQWYVSSDHEMSREHYISFVAFITGDSFVLKKLYPQQNMESRIPLFAHGTLLWYCTKHGLYYKNI